MDWKEKKIDPLQSIWFELAKEKRLFTKIQEKISYPFLKKFLFIGPLIS